MLCQRLPLRSERYVLYIYIYTEKVMKGHTFAKLIRGTKNGRRIMGEKKAAYMYGAVPKQITALSGASPAHLLLPINSCM